MPCTANRSGCRSDSRIASASASSPSSGPAAGPVSRVTAMTTASRSRRAPIGIGYLTDVSPFASRRVLSGRSPAAAILESTRADPVEEQAVSSPADGPASGGLKGLLDLEDIDPGLFRGPISGEPGRRLFGGQVAAQALVAAQRTAEPSAAAHSLHAYFLRPGDTGQPVIFRVDRLQDGRTFAGGGSPRPRTARRSCAWRRRSPPTGPRPSTTPARPRSPSRTTARSWSARCPAPSSPTRRSSCGPSCPGRARRPGSPMTCGSGRWASTRASGSAPRRC